MLDRGALAAHVVALREQRPLVQCMPNVVAAEITANVLLAAGAAPAMVVGREEAPEFAEKKATALSINCGALTAERLDAMREAASAAGRSERRPPWVLDPVACGGTVLTWGSRGTGGSGGPEGRGRPPAAVAPLASGSDGSMRMLLAM